MLSEEALNFIKNLISQVSIKVNEPDAEKVIQLVKEIINWIDKEKDEE